MLNKIEEKGRFEDSRLISFIFKLSGIMKLDSLVNWVIESTVYPIAEGELDKLISNDTQDKFGWSNLNSLGKAINIASENLFFAKNKLSDDDIKKIRGRIAEALIFYQEAKENLKVANKHDIKKIIVDIYVKEIKKEKEKVEKIMNEIRNLLES